MNKSEIIRKAALIAGAPETDAFLFFEIFIRSAADILNPGDIIQIKELGFLHYKIAKANGLKSLKEAKSVFPGSGWVDLIVYSESDEKIYPGDSPYFVVPAKYEHDFAEIDAPFSLSFNKPVIQLLQKRDAYVIPQSYNELIRLLESKAARLLVNAKVIKNENKENEVFIPGVSALEERQISFEHEQKDTAVLPGDQTIISEREKLLSPEAEKEFNELTEALANTLKEDKEQIIPPEEEIAEQKIADLKGEFPETFTEDKKEEVPPTEIVDQKPDNLSVEEKDVHAGDEVVQETTAGAEEKPKKEEKTESSEVKEIDKLLSKASFGANIPWKFDEISIIEPGRREKQEEEEYYEEEESGAEEDKELQDKSDIQREETETMTGAAEEEIGETETKDSGISEESIDKSQIEEREISHPEIHDESLSLSKEEIDKVEIPEEEKHFEELEQEIGREPETVDSGKLAELEQPVTESVPGKVEPEEQVVEPKPAVHDEELGKDEKPKDFSDAELIERTSRDKTHRVVDEKISEPEPEYGTESPDTSTEPAEDKDYKIVEPVKLKYEWKEGYLKDAEEPQIPKDFKEKKEEIETPDEEGYIEIKPGVSKEKIDFLADSEEVEEREVKAKEIVSGEDRAKKDLKEYISKIEEIDKETSHKRKSTTILTLIVFLLFVAVGIFLYYQYIFKKNSSAPGKTLTVIVKNPKTIERDNIIPVTYPYSKNENKDNLYTQPIDSSVLAVSGVGLATSPQVEKSKTETTTQSAPPAKLENLGGYIYRLGNDYIVQIASFNTQTRADAQVASLKKANYDAFVDVVNRTDGSVYYRVMIRGFKSYEQAKSFLK